MNHGFHLRACQQLYKRSFCGKALISEKGLGRATVVRETVLQTIHGHQEDLRKIGRLQREATGQLAILRGANCCVMQELRV